MRRIHRKTSDIKGLSNSRREEVDPDIVVQAVKTKARRARKENEVNRWVTSIFERLHGTDLQAKRVSAER